MHAMQELNSKPPEEIKVITDEMRREAMTLGAQHDEGDKKIKEMRDNLRALIPNVIEITQVANKRTDALDRRRRLEKKILSLYNRFPGILITDQPNIISTDINILKRQLELIRDREINATSQINELNDKLDHLQQQMVDLNRQQRLQTELMNQRDQDKTNLAHNLKNELNNAKTMYSADSRSIDKKMETCDKSMKLMIQEQQTYQNQLDMLKKQRVSLLAGAPPLNAEVSAAIATKQIALKKQIDYYLLWWANRRNLRHYSDRMEFLEEELQKTKNRFEVSYKSIEFIKRENSSRIQELASIRSMNNQLEKSLAETKAKRGQISKRLESVEKSFRPLPSDIDHQIKSLKANLVACQNRAKSLDVELRIYSDNTGSEGLLEKKFEDARRNYRYKLRDVVLLQKSIEKLRKDEEQTEKPANSIHLPLSSIHDNRLLLSDDEIPLVQAGPLDLLVKILFHPGNNEELYPNSLLVLAHTIQSEFPLFVNYLVNSYENTEFVNAREVSLRKLIDVWRNWFPTDFADPTIRNLIGPVMNLIGGASIFEPPAPTPIQFRYDANVPYNSKEKDIIFMSTPSVIAEHLSYIELQLLRNIPASEFVGCGWTSHDKFLKAGHILKMMEHFNMISHLIINSIIHTETIDGRANLIELWIQVLATAGDMGNFQLVFEIIGAFCSPALSQLKKTWRSLSSESNDLMETYRKLTTPGNRFGIYRAELERNPIELSIPYIGPMLTQLVYISDGNPSKKTIPETGENVLNFSKHRMYSAVMDEIIKPWGKEIRFTLNENFLKRIKTIPPIETSDSELYQKAKELEV